MLLFLFGGVLSSHPGIHPLDEVFTYNHLYGSHVKASMVLTRTDHLFIYNYTQLYKITSK